MSDIELGPIRLLALVVVLAVIALVGLCLVIARVPATAAPFDSPVPTPAPVFLPLVVVPGQIYLPMVAR